MLLGVGLHFQRIRPQMYIILISQSFSRGVETSISYFTTEYHIFIVFELFKLV